MSLGDELLKLSLNGKKKTVDPAIEAIRSGRMPTMNDVKRAIKVRNRHFSLCLCPTKSFPVLGQISCHGDSAYGFSAKFVYSIYSISCKISKPHVLGRKFVSVKAFYYPHTPDDYEPYVHMLSYCRQSPNKGYPAPILNREMSTRTGGSSQPMSGKRLRRSSVSEA